MFAGVSGNGREQIASGSTVGTMRIVPFVYGSRAVGMRVGAARLRPTLTVAADGLVHLAEVSLHMSNWTNSSDGTFTAENCNPYQG